MSPVHRPSPWWALAALPLALAAGWLLGSDPALDRRAPATPPRAGIPAPAHSRIQAPAGHAAPGSRPPSEPPRSLFEEPAPVRGVVSSWTTYDAALAESRSSGKPILLDFNAAWCPPCRALQREVFEDADAGRAVCTAVVPVSLVDRSREDGANPPGLDVLQSRFRVDAFPTLVVFSPATGREQRLEGYAGRERTLGWIEQAAASVR